MRQRLAHVIAFVLMMVAPITSSLADSPAVPLMKQTSLGLYITATDAWAEWQANPKTTTILDVRTQEEYMLIGHTTMARNIPVMVMEPIRERISMAPNPDFVAQVKKHYAPDTRLFILCRSGGRSAMAVNILAKEGFTQVYNIVDGFEGDTIKETGHADYGKRKLNGWVNAGAPWTYDLNRELLYLP
ncbi:rhodanese-like domain-containing protein [Desulfoluna spongiiphila]|uniref:rhodanese-like domain-containing protein n=1 Tax=Desulfoluna spongiiphila TaxID=419481 RepID=UPI001256FFBD|nr:rhodanese-like domain-containing protein [Desulfoluna spongiiphila]VVS95700.1 rhodanese-like domain [Desulfoluna spongiiphila]